ncbi:(2E,6E)-farnesyl diphosphate synthase [Pseudoalteromonas piscicida]|uniref:(2E,6E)-farnesyl diphosphate synthase n=1 Tax=Pseudoalteromonas piscicida TaxID=43662 RepID=A0AAD0RHX5_PSEO7|nr:farnesyl diphosphate synthase [Pseudoalteromonas piscicida]ASD66207.1 (2E,6E)-farnesyl diphosphate synthase [Pseudoalteromonas piscicida]AXQ97131.1 (2E,6E)-farnesyl diphosphate synthase [Pseudoalteromonas piscicida]AXR03087.1 (2E,6E)-farnesyl diphosphate synthase [Pseudoalteromonas piscicida]
MSAKLQEKLLFAKTRVENTVLHYFDSVLDTEENIKAATRYSIENGGKRLRPFLVYCTGELFGAVPADLDKAAAAIECVHSYSLVHDDLPAMDDDELRRGRPTCHIQFDEATAILAGDALQTLAFELLSEHQFAVNQHAQIKMISVLAKASGLQGMVGGQALDIAATDRSITIEELERIHKLKTGALLSCAVELGILCGNPERVTEQACNAIRTYGRAIGLAFQVRDDILDVEGDTIVLGKPQGSDLEHNKSTYPALLGLEQAKEKAEQLIDEALDALTVIDGDTEILADLAKYIIDREY